MARLKAAIIMGRGVIQRPVGEKVAQASPADMEAPLDPMEKASMAEAWTKRYGVALTMWMDPADPIVNRLWREFRQNCPSLIAVNRVRSIYADRNPNPEKKVTIGGGLVVTLAGKEQHETIKDIAQYYFGLRILANASAKAGNYEFDSKAEQGKKVVFAPLDVNIDYADHAFRMALEQTGTPWAVLKWLEKRDHQTRGLMCNLMRSGYPQGEALALAMEKQELKWGSPLPGQNQGGQSIRRDRSRTPPRGGNAGSSGSGPSGPKMKGGLGKTARQQAKGQQKGNVRYANMARGGVKICRAYNDGSCKGEKCPYGGAHVCSVIEGGKTCGGKHPAFRHSSAQGR